VREIQRPLLSLKDNLTFKYDGLDNRYYKFVKQDQATENTWVYHYYVRDAQGNTLAMYKRSYKVSGNDVEENLHVTEHHLYASSRVGVQKHANRLVARATFTFSGTYEAGTGKFDNPTGWSLEPPIELGNLHERNLGEKHYELTNHLGNVLVTIADMKLPQDPDLDNKTEFFTADVTSAQEYYPFGMLRPNRTLDPGGYRFGFNGMEKGDEVKGVGNSLNFGARIYDSRGGLNNLAQRYAQK